MLDLLAGFVAGLLIASTVGFTAVALYATWDWAHRLVTRPTHVDLARDRGELGRELRADDLRADWARGWHDAWTTDPSEPSRTESRAS